MEKWDAYTRDGRLTGEILIRGEKIPNGLYHIACDVLVRHTDGTFLLMKRSAEKEQHGGYFEATAGGSVLMGEDKLACVKRELFEETGIVCDSFTEVASFVFDSSACIFYCFVCTVDCDKDSVKLQEGETEDYLWLTEKEFKVFLKSDKCIKPQIERYTDYFREIGLNL